MKLLTRCLLPAMGALVAALGVSTPALAIVPLPATGCDNLTRTQTSASPQAIPAGGSILQHVYFGTQAGPITDVDVHVSAVHAQPGELTMTLTGPSGVIVTLADHDGGSQTNAFSNVTFDDQAATAVATASGAGAAAYRPRQALTAFHVDGIGLGAFSLTVTDAAPGVTGTLSEWSVTVTTCLPALGNTAPPRVLASSDLHPGVRLGLDAGTWVRPTPWPGIPMPTITTLWLKCDSVGAACVEGPTADFGGYVLTTSDIGSTYRIRSTGTQHEHAPIVVTSAATAVVKVTPVPVDTRPPVASFTIARLLALPKQLSKPIRVTLVTDEVSSVVVEFRLTPKMAKALKLPVVLGTRKLATTHRGGNTISFVFTAAQKRKLAGSRKLPLTISIQATDAAKNVRTIARSVVLKR